MHLVSSFEEDIAIAKQVPNLKYLSRMCKIGYLNITFYRRMSQSKCTLILGFMGRVRRFRIIFVMNGIYRFEANVHHLISLSHMDFLLF